MGEENKMTMEKTNFLSHFLVNSLFKLYVSNLRTILIKNISSGRISELNEVCITLELNKAIVLHNQGEMCLTSK